MVRLEKHRRFASLAPAAVALIGGAFALGLAASCGSSTGSTTGAGAHGSGGGSHVSSGASQGTQGTAGATGASSGTGGTGGAPPKPCAGDADCAGNPKGAVCDTATGECVSCLPAKDTCGMGQFCDPATHACASGCKVDADCAADPGGTHCETTSHACVGCLTEGDCPAGQVCALGVHLCVPGCSPTHACAAGLTCCGTYCHDLTSDVADCGACGKGCVNPPNATDQCSSGMCTLKACAPAFADCNGNLADGCEWNVLQDGPCTCAPGATQSCYQGAPGTQNVGPCHAGTQTCDASGTSWGACLGQVLPVSEICNNNVDDDCNGVVDDVPDQDGDGWTVCNGDCNDNNKLVNPGAFEVPGDGIDNDCDGIVDNPVTTVCGSAGQKFTGVTGTDVINAMDICQFTTANAPLPMKKWGVIAATQTHADGGPVTVTEAQNSQTAIKTSFGTGGVLPKKNGTLAVISSGMARAAADPGWVLPIAGTTFTSSLAFPGGGALGTYTNAHGGGLLPGKCGAMTCPVGSGANDSISIRFKIRVPTNAQGFSYDFRFYSAEYHTYQCTQYNDYYLASLTSGVAGIPADHNISFDSLNNAVSVNNGFFQDCGGNGKSCGSCPYGTTSLLGTGFGPDSGGPFSTINGGSTEWLTTDSPILPGETMTLELMVFDVSDHVYDTLVLLDNFRWSLTPVILGTHT